MRPWWLALTLTVGCAPAAWRAWTDGGATIDFPSPPEVRRVGEGPWAEATVASARHDGSTYELARFVLTTRPDDERRGLLLAEVERGLRARRGLVDLRVSAARFHGRRARRLSLAFDDGAAARFIVFYRDATTLVELSVFGPAEGIDARAERFFSGYSPPSSASDAS